MVREVPAHDVSDSEDGVAGRGGRRVPDARRGPGRRRLLERSGCRDRGLRGQRLVQPGGRGLSGHGERWRAVTSAITSTNVSQLGVAWCVPLAAADAGFGNYATTPVVVNGVVYAQDLQSNVMAVRLATGKVLWTHTYNSRNGGPDGVNVVGRVVYAATGSAAVALDAATAVDRDRRLVVARVGALGLPGHAGRQAHEVGGVAENRRADGG